MMKNIIKSAIKTNLSPKIFFLPTKTEEINNKISESFECLKDERSIVCYTEIDLVVCGHSELDVIKAYKICNFNHVNLFCIWDVYPPENLSKSQFQYAQSMMGNFNWFLNKEVMNAWHMNGFNGDLIEKIKMCLNKPFMRLAK